MKLFLVNVNECLNLSQYGPFFYEHMQNGQLTVLDEIADTCELDKTYQQIREEINQKPFSCEKALVILLIPRNLTVPLAPQSCELYHDINVHMHLDVPLRNNFRFCTVYIDKTGELELDEKVYLQIRTINEEFCSDGADMTSVFPDLLHDAPQNGDYREFIRKKITALAPCTRVFFERILEEMPEMPTANALQIRNGIHYFIGQCKARLSGIRHACAPCFRDDIAEDIRTKLRVVYYIKELAEKDIALDAIPPFQNADPDFDHIRRLLATYRVRLSKWYHDSCTIDKRAECSRGSFSIKTHAAGEFCAEVDTLILGGLSNLDEDSVKNTDVVNAIFDKLDMLVANVREKLEVFAWKESKELYDPTNYNPGVKEKFALDEPPTEDELEERRQLEQMNRYSVHNLPNYVSENALVQELDRINDQIQQVYACLQVYARRSFLITLLIGVLTVMTLYFGAQYSVFLKENTWWIFGAYGMLVTLGFSIGYGIVRKKYVGQIRALLMDCYEAVKVYLSGFKSLAIEFENNLIQAGNYRCLKEYLDEKAMKRAEYEERMARYAWHKSRVKDILTNLSAFEYFIQNADPYPDNATLDSYDHDDEHTKFYQLKQF